MACLALSLQPMRGPDILLQTLSWFPPVRAMSASKAFRGTRKADAFAELDLVDRTGDDPLAASSGQVVVGSDYKYRVVYRLVSNVYVLGISSADQDDTSINVFRTTYVVSQAVSILVAACRGVDVTTEKLNRKYPEVYLALDAVLHGVSPSRLSFLINCVQSDTAALLRPPPQGTFDAEIRARGAQSWALVKGAAIDRVANVEIFSNAEFVLPAEAYAAGDEAMATFAPPPSQTTFEKAKEEVKPSSATTGDLIDPFAASDMTPAQRAAAELGAFRKTAGASDDPIAQLAGLSVPAPKRRGTYGVDPVNSQFSGPEGFEGDYGGMDWAEGDAFGGGLLGDDGDAWGGGLDPAAFGAEVEQVSAFGGGFGGLQGDILGPGRKLEAELAATTTEGPSLDSDVGARLVAESKAAAVAAEAAAKAAMPSIYVTEEMNAQFQGLSLARVGLHGTVVLRLPPGRKATADTEFSFRLEGSQGIKRALLKPEIANSLGSGFFHVRAAPHVEGTVSLIKYRLQPRFTPVPLRIRFHTRRSEDSLSLMIQYVANPALAAPLTNVIFIMSLPFSPAAIRLSPSATLHPQTKELRWKISSIGPSDAPKRLRAQIPVIPEHLIYKSATPSEEEVAAEDARKAKELAAFKIRVVFAVRGMTLSGMSVSPTGTSASAFHVGANSFQAVKYTCTAA
eukprot:TRINITY_DN16502_c0_g1_i1.p1 TRINITY_DN16502_c0_g1~~TRINITY_DN16502_c0_g1_i1.p1  ORF type:complete len:680 (+),score=137.66 TRINITY_DN16502_c0_g1_i1:530-2569(+)